MVKKVKKTDHDAKIAETKIKVLNPTDLVKKRFRHIREKIVNKFCVGSKDGVTHALDYLNAKKKDLKKLKNNK